MTGLMNVGIVGAVTRGSGFARSLGHTGFFRGHALCDTNEEGLRRIQAETGAFEVYTDYREMLEQADIQAVLIGTPMPFHAPMAIAALEKNLHVLSEVTAAVSIDESRALVAAAGQSDGIYMMAENYTFMKPNMIIRDLVARGLFGDPYYAEGEYLHELKELNEKTPWRRESTASPTAPTASDPSSNGCRAIGSLRSVRAGAVITTVTGAATTTKTRTPPSCSAVWPVAGWSRFGSTCCPTDRTP